METKKEQTDLNNENGVLIQSCVSVSVTDLRIGNLILLPNGEIAKVGYEIIRALIVLQDKPNYKPIPLTEDWLIKFGFKKNETFCFIHINSGIELMNISNKYYRGYYRGSTIKADIKFVHQLQNLYYALNGSEFQISYLTER